MYVKKENKIAEQSRQWLITSLLTLMEKKNFNDITISEIANHAGLSRVTFYRIFNSKEEILEQYFYMICDEYIDCFDETKQYKLHDIIVVFFEFWEQHISFLNLMIQNNLYYDLLDKFNQFLPIIHQSVTCKTVKYNNPFELEIGLLTNAGVLWNIIPKWLEQTPRPSGMEMSEIIINGIKRNL